MESLWMTWMACPWLTDVGLTIVYLLLLVASYN